jgi:hypothetical protein
MIIHKWSDFQLIYVNFWFFFQVVRSWVKLVLIEFLGIFSLIDWFNAQISLTVSNVLTGIYLLIKLSVKVFTLSTKMFIKVRSWISFFIYVNWNAFFCKLLKFMNHVQFFKKQKIRIYKFKMILEHTKYLRWLMINVLFED